MGGLQQNHTAGISLIAFIVAVAISVGFYQFIYVPEASQKPVLRGEVVEPGEVTEITIAEGAADAENGVFYIPADERAILGVSNRVIWHNADSIAHTVTTDDGYSDIYS